MSIDVMYVAPYEGWLNRETKEIFDILTKVDGIRQTLREDWCDIFDENAVMTFCINYLRGYFSAIPAHVWDNPQKTIAWFEIYNRLTLAWGKSGTTKGDRKRTLQLQRTRKKVIENYILPNIKHVSKNYSYISEDTDEGRLMIFRINGTKALLRHVQTQMTFLRIPSGDSNSMRMANSFLSCLGMANQMQVTALNGFQKRASSDRKEFKVRSFDTQTLKVREALCKFAGILVDCNSLTCSLFLDTKCEILLGHVLRNPLKVGRKYLWT